MRRSFVRASFALVASFCLVFGGLPPASSDTDLPEAPKMLPDGTWAAAPYEAVEIEAPGSLRAGAGTGDITPPPGSPMTGFYVARHCGIATAAGAQGQIESIVGQAQDDPTEAPYASSQCIAPRFGPDTDGYAKTFPASEGRYGRLRAQAVVIDDGARKTAVVSVDLPGIFGEMHEAVANRVADLGITREFLLISASHTHTGPGGYFQQNLGWAALGGDLLDPRIFEAITSGIVHAIRTADERLEPAKLAAGEVELQGLNGNRRRPQWDLNPEAVLEIDPPNAPRLGMIRVDTAGGVPIGAITNFSTHGVIGGGSNMWFTGDDKGWVSRLLEEAIREEADLPEDHPIVGATLNGAQGDIGTGSCERSFPASGTNYHDFICMENSGMRQAEAYMDLWRALGAELSDEVSVDARYDTVCFCGQEVPEDPYDPFDRGEWVPENDDPAYFNVGHIAIQGEGRAPATLFPGHHRRQPLLIGPPGVSPKNVRIQVLRVGNAAFASMPGEPTIQIGRRVERSVKSALAGLADHVWVAGLGNDHNAYYTTIQEYEAYLYEGGWTFFGQQSGNLLKLRLVDLAERMATAKPDPPCTPDRHCIDNPDTSAIAVDPQPLVPDPAPEIANEPTSVERFVRTHLDWIGGGPGAEWRPGEATVTLQRLDGENWVDVASDLDPVLPVGYAKRHGLHRYSALFDPVADQPLGTYRLVVTGARATAPATTEAYDLTSEPFDVKASLGLLLAQGADGRWTVEHPEPDPQTNYRWRARSPGSWTLVGLLNGAVFSASDPFELAPGDELVVPVGGITDAHGNTNGSVITVSVPDEAP